VSDQQISAHDKTNFATLKRAFKDGRVALVRCQRVSDRKYVTVLCMVNGPDESGMLDFVPFAEMPDGNPYAAYIPPSP